MTDSSNGYFSNNWWPICVSSVVSCYLPWSYNKSVLISQPCYLYWGSHQRRWYCYRYVALIQTIWPCCHRVWAMHTTLSHHPYSVCNPFKIWNLANIMAKSNASASACTLNFNFCNVQCKPWPTNRSDVDRIHLADNWCAHQSNADSMHIVCCTYDI